MIPSRSSFVSSFPLRSMIHLELMFVNGVKQGWWVIFSHYGQWIGLATFMGKTILFSLNCSGPCLVHVWICSRILCSVLWYYYHYYLGFTTDSQYNHRWRFTFLIAIDPHRSSFLCHMGEWRRKWRIPEGGCWESFLVEGTFEQGLGGWIGVWKTHDVGKADCGMKGLEVGHRNLCSGWWERPVC